MWILYKICSKKQKTLLKGLFVYFVIFESLAFLREAVFFLNTPLLVALSIVL
jgi:hypothetical protein